MSNERATANFTNMLGGTTLIAIGGIFSIISAGYDMGTLNQMGPGFFPFILGAALACLGGLDLVRSFLSKSERESLADLHWRSLICIPGSLLLFALMIGPLGFVPALACATLLALLAKPPFRVGYAAIYTIGLTAAGYVVFIVGLGMPVSAFGW